MKKRIFDVILNFETGDDKSFGLAYGLIQQPTAVVNK